MLSEEVGLAFLPMSVFRSEALTRTHHKMTIKVIEKYTKNVRFCLICNYVSKIIPAIQSRCTRFRFSPLQEDQIENRLSDIVLKEGIRLTDDGRKALVKLSQGDMRRALNILQVIFNTRMREAQIYSIQVY
jgi:replication factor C subunit 3/5